MRWVKYLKRGCAVTLTAALLAGGANWYSLKLKAVSLSGQEGLAEPGGPNGPEGEMPLDADAQTAADSIQDEGSTPQEAGEPEDGGGLEKTEIPEADDIHADGAGGASAVSQLEESSKTESTVFTETVSVEDTFGLDNDALFEGYLGKLFYGDYGQMPASLDLEEQFQLLNEDEKKFYKHLKTKITQIAEGNETSTQINFADTGVKLTADSRQQLDEKLADFRLKQVYLILADCPFELYWCDKTAGISFSYGISQQDGVYTAESFVMKFPAAQAYADKTTAPSSGRYYCVNADGIRRAREAKENARKIVSENAGLADYEKLKAYKDEICALNEYNDAAAGGGMAYGDPWQLVYVFDGDPATQVVCEGYSKAFAYLCELSQFYSSQIKCYLASGMMSTATGGGPHMWNLVAMDDGRSYLVDVTNCDEGTVGYPDKLFLAGCKSSGNGQYTFRFDDAGWNDTTYTYDEETKKLYPQNILSLAEQNYTLPASSTVSLANKSEADGGYPTACTYSGSPVPEPVLDNFSIQSTDAGSGGSIPETVSWNFQYSWHKGDQTGNQADLENSLLKNAPSNAGTYTLAVEISADGYEPARTAILVTIEKAALTSEMFHAKLPGDGSVFYTGSPHLASVTGTGIAGSLEAGEISVTYKKDGENGFADEPTDPGIYHLFVTVSGNRNLKDAAELDIQASFEIREFTPQEGTAAILSGGTDESDWKQSVVLTAPEGFLIAAALDGQFAQSMDWNVENPAESGEHKKQTEIVYYLKQAESGALCTQPQSVYAYIDRTAPDFSGSGDGIHIEESTEWWKTLLETITFGYYKQNQVSVTASDSLSGVAEYYYYIDNPQGTQESTAPTLTKEQLDAKDQAGDFQKTENGRFAAAENQASVIYAYAADRAGNRSEYISSQGIIHDTEAPSLSVLADADSMADTSAAFTVSASENAAGFYLVKKAGEAAPQGMDDFAVKAESYVPLDGVKELALSPSPAAAKTDGLECNTQYCFYVIAADKAGNISDIAQADFTTRKQMLVFDETQIPVITGIYGQKVSQMQLSFAPDAGESTVPGSWKISENQDDMPKPGEEGGYQIEFVPDDTDAYEVYVTQAVAEIAPRPVDITIQDVSEVYGQPDPEFTFQLAEDSQLAGEDTLEDLQIVLKLKADADMPQGQALPPGTYQITGECGNPNYKAAFQKGTFTVRKKPAEALDGSPEQKNYPYTAGSGEHPVQVSIREKLPEDAGTVSSYEPAVSGSNPDIVTQYAVSDDGVLSYQIAAAPAPGSSAVIAITINTANYEPLVYEIRISLTDKLQAVPAGEISLAPGNSLTYGDTLSRVVFANTQFVAEGTQDAVPGRLEVKEPDAMPKAGTSQIAWIFTPDDMDIYDVQTGVVEITVARRQVSIANKDYKTDYKYTGEPVPAPEASQFEVTGQIGADGWNPLDYLSFSWYEGDDGDSGNQMQGLPVETGRYLLKAELAESENYTGAVWKAPVTVENCDAADAVLDYACEGTGGWYHGDVTILPPQGYLISADKKVWNPQIVVTQDRQGPYRYYLKETATGYISREKQITVNRDTVAPAGSITVAGSRWDRFLETITFGLYTRTEDIVTIQAQDAASGMDGGKIEYIITDENEKYEGSDGIEQLEHKPQEAWTVLTGEARITKNRSNIVYARLTDLAGNTAYLSTDIIVHEDENGNPGGDGTDGDGTGGNPGGDGTGSNPGGDGSGGNPGGDGGSGDKPGSGDSGSNKPGSGSTGDSGSKPGEGTGNTGSGSGDGNTGNSSGNGSGGNPGSSSGNGSGSSSGGSGSGTGGGSGNGTGGSSGSGNPGSSSGTGNSTHPADSHQTETKPDGTVIETSRQTSADGTKTETVTETRRDGTKTETITKTQNDGSRIKTVTETHANGTKTETVTETAPNGETVKSVTETASDGSAYATIRSAKPDADGNLISRIVVKKIASTGAVIQTVEKSTFTLSRTKSVVTTVKDSRNQLVKASANLTMQGVLSATGSMLDLNGYVTDRIAREAGTRDVKITVTVKDSRNKVLYKLNVNKNQLSAGNELYVYAYEPETKHYAMVNSSRYAVSDAQSIAVRVPDKGNYILLDKAEMNRVSREILKTVKLAKTSQTEAPGKKVKISLDKGADTQSIAKITYTSSNKKVASVSKNGTVKAKSKGTARIKAAVTMKNGKTKTLSMKIKVR